VYQHRWAWPAWEGVRLKAEKRLFLDPPILCEISLNASCVINYAIREAASTGRGILNASITTIQSV
jgi:hypothetical protein